MILENRFLPYILKKHHAGYFMLLDKLEEQIGDSFYLPEITEEVLTSIARTPDHVATDGRSKIKWVELYDRYSDGELLTKDYVKRLRILANLKIEEL